MKDFKSLPQYGNRSKKFVNRYKTNNRVAILKDKQVFALCTATLTFVPNEHCPKVFDECKYTYSVPHEWIHDDTHRYGYYRVISDKKPRRNAKCSCGSDLKYKKCCMK